MANDLPKSPQFSFETLHAAAHGADSWTTALCIHSQHAGIV